jgi:hypothetical protein
MRSESGREGAVPVAAAAVAPAHYGLIHGDCLVATKEPRVDRQTH